MPSFTDGNTKRSLISEFSKNIYTVYKVELYITL